MNSSQFPLEPLAGDERLRTILQSAPYEEEELSEEEQAALDDLERLRNEETIDSEELRARTSAS